MAMPLINTPKCPASAASREHKVVPAGGATSLSPNSLKPSSNPSSDGTVTNHSLSSCFPPFITLPRQQISMFSWRNIFFLLPTPSCVSIYVRTEHLPFCPPKSRLPCPEMTSKCPAANGVSCQTSVHGFTQDPAYHPSIAPSVTHADHCQDFPVVDSSSMPTRLPIALRLPFLHWDPKVLVAHAAELSSWTLPSLSPFPGCVGGSAFLEALPDSCLGVFPRLAKVAESEESRSIASARPFSNPKTVERRSRQEGTFLPSNADDSMI